jgi:hypothetical protein
MPRRLPGASRVTFNLGNIVYADCGLVTWDKNRKDMEWTSVTWDIGGREVGAHIEYSDKGNIYHMEGSVEDATGNACIELEPCDAQGCTGIYYHSWGPQADQIPFDADITKAVENDDRVDGKFCSDDCLDNETHDRGEREELERDPMKFYGLSESDF